MALARQVQHQIRIRLSQRVGRGLRIGEIHPEQPVAAFALWGGGPLAQLRQHLLDAGEIAGVAARVEVEDQRLAVCEQAAPHGPAVALGFCAAVEAAAAGHQDAAAAGEQGGNVGRGGGGHGRRRTHVLKSWLSWFGRAA
jgi:hypothetical protein